MAVEYKTIVPWGRSFDEYVKMFDLSHGDLAKKLISFGDGPAAFNAVLSGAGGHVVSIDPIYQFDKQQIKQRINETFNTVMEQTKNNLDKFIWKDIKSLEELGVVRMNSMERFLEDYEIGKSKGRYMYGELPSLPNLRDEFDIALSSHFLFLYSDNLSYSFHEKSIESMLSISQEVRIFPLLDNNARRSKYVNRIMDFFMGKDYMVEEKSVDYEFQKNGNKMLRISK